MYNMHQYIKSTPFANHSIHSYSRLYPDISQLSSDFTPETRYYAHMAGFTPFDILVKTGINDVIYSMNEILLFSSVIWNDIYLNVHTRSKDEAVGYHFDRYLKYTT